MEGKEYFSVDDHIIEHPHLWLDRAPDELKERVPQIIEVGGRDAWCYDGAVSYEVGTSAVVGSRPPEEYSKDPTRFDEMRPGYYDIAARIEDQDADGVTTQVCFPNYGGFVGRTFLEAKDKDLAKWCIETYNDFVIDEWCAYAPGRQVPCTMVPMWDVTIAAAELARCAEKGTKAVTFSENPYLLGQPTWHHGYWDPLFAVAQEANVPLCLHIGSSSVVACPSPESSDAAWAVLSTSNAMQAATDLLFSPVFYDFPRLKVVMSEGGCGWVPFLLERSDWVFERHRWWAGVEGDRLPSELFDEHMWVCFISHETLGVELRDRIGVHKLLWESDYPHSDSLWPSSVERLDVILKDVPEDEAQLIRCDNAKAVFNVG